jgi:single-strand DNA-binding protein
MLNHIVLMGRLVRDPELRHTGSGTAVASFSLAVDRDYKSQNGDRETDFIDIVAWRSTADYVSRYFSKGRMAVVSGRLQVRSYTDKEGIRRKTSEVVADSVYFGDSKRENSEAYAPPAYDTPHQYTPPDVGPTPGEFTAMDGADDKDLPF